MDRVAIIAELDKHIADLAQARVLLMNGEALASTGKRSLSIVKPKRTMSAKGREAIAKAQQKRWRKAKRERSAKKDPKSYQLTHA
jgi:hypothetical protein